MARNSRRVLNFAFGTSLLVGLLGAWLFLVHSVQIFQGGCGLSEPLQNGVLAVSLLGGLFVVFVLCRTQLHSQLNNGLFVVLVGFVIFVGLRGHRFVFYWDWEVQCDAGEGACCSALAYAHRNWYGLQESKALFYETLACEFGSPNDCMKLVERGQTTFSMQMCQTMATYCVPKSDTATDYWGPMCASFERYCGRH